MTYPEALLIAELVKGRLEPHCDRIEIAGSTRRKREVIGDIEIVCIPKKFSVEVNKYEKVKGEPTGRYTQRLFAGVVKLDIFMCQKENWGNIFAIRTGSADFSHKVLATGWVKKGYESEGGFLTKDDKIVLRGI